MDVGPSRTRKILAALAALVIGLLLAGTLLVAYGLSSFCITCRNEEPECILHREGKPDVPCPGRERSGKD